MKSIFATLAAAMLVAAPAMAKETRYAGWVLNEDGEACSLFSLDRPDPFLGLVRAYADGQWATSIIALDEDYGPQVGTSGDVELSVGGTSAGTIYFLVDDGDGDDIPGAVMTRIGNPDPTAMMRGKPVDVVGRMDGRVVFDQTFDPPADALAAWRACSR